MTKRYAGLKEVIKETNIAKNATLSPEAIEYWTKKALATHSLAYILADAAESFLMECDEAMHKIDKQLVQKVKQDFKEMHRCVHASYKATNKAVQPMYKTNSNFTDNGCIDSDWWYNFLKLIDDRVGTNPQKTHLLLEFLLTMPSEGEGLFNPKFEDFVTKKV